MADLSKIKLNGVEYNLKDNEAREAIVAIGEGSIANIPVATSTSNGLMSASDKRLLNNLNPNIVTTLSNINTSEFQIINAKDENILDMVITAEPIIES